jgi:hypothetical protein
MVNIVPDAKAQEALDILHDTAWEAAEAVAEAKFQKEFLKTIKAQLRGKSGGKTEGQKDDFATTHVTYIDALNKWREAEIKAAHFSHQRSDASTVISVWQSENRRNTP